MRDWAAWQAAYDDPSSSPSVRLRLVRGHLSRALDRAPQVRAWFRASGFDEVAFDSPDTEALTGVGVHRLAADPAAELPSGHLFTFRGS